ncbi:transcription termination factor NusA [Pelolinea submarina]|uniref:Transcription termination/antitermination protein NusA n=1 Tax=Pelolinea submarina TaxID=913107 RepID=A0A347ZW19_9CHLR|nr:transcription termination factor NusA [Pelolinea submarina]REG07196.1 NusA antitermination factor [Pelolinea submarina]BBB49500.1 N utilization substance protein A [Pelolinea submarina]
MKNEFVLAFNEVLEEKGLPKETILEALAHALVSAYRKSMNVSSAQEVKAIIDLDKGEFGILAEKEVVEEVQNDLTEVTLEVARQFDPEANLGDLVMVDSTPEDFGRVAAQNARQVIQEKIRQAEYAAQIEYYEKQLGEIISGIVQATNSQGMTIGLELNAEGTMPRKEMIPFERFRIHDRVRALVAEIKETGRGPQIILSRTHRDFLRRLLENEVPEIFHGVVEIRSIAREPGHRAKVAVSTSQQGIDPVGACVGQRGVRIQAIVRELHDEKIDVIEWNPDPTAFIAKAISPARVNGVYLKESVDGSRNALVVVPEDQLSLAIGRDGQNARLAAKLTGWRIDIKSLPESISDWLFSLQNKPELKEMAEEEKEAIAQAEDIMARKVDGRVINPEEYDFLTKFNDRLEKYATRKHQAEFEKQQKLRDEVMETIPPAAFEMDLSGTGLQANILEALVEAGYDTAGKLVLTSKLNPDALLEVNGFGPKALERVAEFAEVLPELIPEPVEEEEPVAEQPVEEQPELEAEIPVEIQEETILEAGQPEEPEAQLEETVAAEAEKPTAEEGEEELSFDQMFTVKPEAFEPEEESEDEEESSEEGGTTDGKKKRKKKVKRFRELEYDPERDVVVAKKKHKRDGTPWNEWEEE